MKIYNYSIKNAQGKEISLEQYKGKVLIIVNTATRCGFTPQYQHLEALYEKYHEKGLEIIDIPCNQFGHQAPENDVEISQFCQLHYGTKFPQMQKAEVNGKNELPLYTYLKSQQGFKTFGKGFQALMMNIMSKFQGSSQSSDIRWNFTKFVINREGKVIARFEPTQSMEELEHLIEQVL